VAELASGRIASVAGAVIERSDDPRGATGTARLLAALFEDVVWVGGDRPAEAPCRRATDVAGAAGDLRDIASALAAAQTERVLVVCAARARVTPDLLLALVAWPEADVVVPGTIAAAPPPVALYRREPTLRLIATQLAEDRCDARALFGALECHCVAPEVLPDVEAEVP
jgi:molybdopterin-guanine dinucleotide biosynthesis protein A